MPHCIAWEQRLRTRAARTRGFAWAQSKKDNLFLLQKASSHFCSHYRAMQNLGVNNISRDSLEGLWNIFKETLLLHLLWDGRGSKCEVTKETAAVLHSCKQGKTWLFKARPEGHCGKELQTCRRQEKGIRGRKAGSGRYTEYIYWSWSSRQCPDYQQFG